MLELREARVHEFFKKINANFGRRWAWSWNTPLDASSVDDAMKVSYQLISIKKENSNSFSFAVERLFHSDLGHFWGSFLLFWYIPVPATPMSEFVESPRYPYFDPHIVMDKACRSRFSPSR
jgi:hypothetical protein